jgi:ATP synthase protein I
LKITDGAFSDTLYGVGTIGLHLVACTFVGMGMGYLLDWWLGTKPWLTMTLLLFGIAAGFRNVYLEAKRLQRKYDRPGNAEDE